MNNNNQRGPRMRHPQPIQPRNSAFNVKFKQVRIPMEGKPFDYLVCITTPAISKDGEERVLPVERDGRTPMNRDIVTRVVYEPMPPDAYLHTAGARCTPTVLEMGQKFGREHNTGEVYVYMWEVDKVGELGQEVQGLGRGMRGEGVIL